MPRAARQILVDALDNLERHGFRRFKQHLTEAEVERDFSRIPRGRLEGADTVDVVNLMISYYREEFAGRLAVQLLREINERSIADGLEGDLNPGGAVVRGAGAKPQGTVVHPVEKHFIQIVQNFNSVDAVLDSLLARQILTTEHYDKIRSYPTRQEKSRELCVIVRGRGSQAKDALWDAMVDIDPFFTNNLSGQ
ncbi:apoptosis-associated speck-like protein containing a CARD [Heptranchias perlo]|uniref:apoptosis-associated speck-like protein containing a CARD n=1 Tax=Heptranchias perlo TaxID=212740 RepID=UPI003559C9FC